MREWLQRHPRGKQLLSIGAGIALAIVCLLVWASTINLQDVLHHLTKVKPVWLLIWVVLDVTAFGIRSQRWRLLIFNARRPAASEAMAICWCARASGILLPVRGGDVVRTVLAQRVGVPWASGTVATLLDKGFDLLTVLFGFALVPFVLGTSALAVFARPLPGRLVLTVMVLALGIGLAIWLAWQRNLLPRRALQPITAKVSRGVEAMVPIGRLFLKSPQTALGALALTGVASIIDFASSIAMFYSVDSTISPLRLIIGGALFDVQFILPAPPGQVGSYELAGQLIYASVLGIDASVVGAVTVIGNIMGNSLCTICGGISLAFLGGLRPGDAKDLVETSQPSV